MDRPGPRYGSDLAFFAPCPVVSARPYRTGWPGPARR